MAEPAATGRTSKWGRIWRGAVATAALAGAAAGGYGTKAVIDHGKISALEHTVQNQDAQIRNQIEALAQSAQTLAQVKNERDEMMKRMTQSAPIVIDATKNLSNLVVEIMKYRLKDRSAWANFVSREDGRQLLDIAGKVGKLLDASVKSNILPSADAAKAGEAIGQIRLGFTLANRQPPF